jgi:hypothetical protein
MSPLTRRRWLRLAAVGGVLALGGGGAVSLGWGKELLLRWLVADEASRRLGRAYLATLPAPVTAASLRASLTLPRFPLGIFEIRDRVEHELRQGDTHWLDGWLVSETEARICALAWLIGSRPRHP